LRPDPLAHAGALRPQTAPAVVHEALRRVGKHGDVRFSRILFVGPVATAGDWVCDVAEPEGREEAGAAGEERQEQDERRKDKQSVLSHRTRRPADEDRTPSVSPTRSGSRQRQIDALFDECNFSCRVRSGQLQLLYFVARSLSAAEHVAAARV